MSYSFYSSIVVSPAVRHLRDDLTLCCALLLSGVCGRSVLIYEIDVSTDGGVKHLTKAQ